MKKIILSFAMMISAMAVFAQNEAFKSFAKHFGDSAAFAYTTVGNRQVMLVSHETFGNNADANLEAVETSIFALDPKGKIVSLGSIRSQGTLYPVSVLDNKLMVAGHQFVRIYSIRGDVPELVLDSYEEGDSESPKLKAMFTTFEKGKAILFNRHVEDNSVCQNTFRK